MVHYSGPEKTGLTFLSEIGKKLLYNAGRHGDTSSPAAGFYVATKQFSFSSEDKGLTELMLAI